MDNLSVQPQILRVMVDVRPGIFYEVSGGYLLSKVKIKAFTTLAIGSSLPASSMFSINWLILNNESIGWLLSSQFHVDNGGGYLATYLQGKAGKATVADVIKDQSLIIYNYPNRGSLAISPLVGPDVLDIFDEQ